MSHDASDTDKLLELQHECDLCKEAIIEEGDPRIKEKMEGVCEICQKVRVRVPDLIELRKKMQDFNAKHKH